MLPFCSVFNWLNFLCTELYNSSTPTLWASQIALIQPFHGQGYILKILDRMHLLFTQGHFRFDSLARVNMLHKLCLCWDCCMDAPRGFWRSIWCKEKTDGKCIKCYVLFCINHRSSNALNCIVFFILSKLEDQSMFETNGEVRTNAFTTFYYWLRHERDSVRRSTRS